MSVHYSSAVWAADIGDPLAKLVLLKLADNANDNGDCWPSIATICRETQLSERSVQRKIRLLEEGGFLKSERSGNSADYSLNMKAIKSKKMDASPEKNDTHPVTQSPRHTVTPSHSHPVTETPSPRHTVTLL